MILDLHCEHFHERGAWSIEVQWVNFSLREESMFRQRCALFCSFEFSQKLVQHQLKALAEFDTIFIIQNTSSAQQVPPAFAQSHQQQLHPCAHLVKWIYLHYHIKPPLTYQ